MGIVKGFLRKDGKFVRPHIRLDRRFAEGGQIEMDLPKYSIVKDTDDLIEVRLLDDGKNLKFPKAGLSSNFIEKIRSNAVQSLAEGGDVFDQAGVDENLIKQAYASTIANAQFPQADIDSLARYNPNKVDNSQVRDFTQISNDVPIDENAIKQAYATAAAIAQSTPPNVNLASTSANANPQSTPSGNPQLSPQDQQILDSLMAGIESNQDAPAPNQGPTTPNQGPTAPSQDPNDDWTPQKIYEKVVPPARKTASELLADGLPPQDEPVPNKEAVEAGVPQRKPASRPSQGAPRPNGINDGYKQQFDAIAETGRLDALKAQAQAKIKEQELKDMEAVKANFEKEIARNKADREAIVRDIHAFRLDPNRIWADKTTSQKIQAAAAVAMGAWAATLSGSNKNYALDIINNAVDRDIEAQKVELGKKNSLLSAYLQEGNSMQQAYSQARSDLLTAAAAQVELVALRLGDENAIAKANFISGQLKVAADKDARNAAFVNAQMAAMRSKATRSVNMKEADDMLARAALGKALSGNPMSNTEIEMLPDGARKRAIRISDDGKVAFATTDKGAELIIKNRPAMKTLEKQVADYRKLIVKHGTDEIGAVGAQMDQLAIQIQDTVRIANDWGTPQEGELELLVRMVPNPGWMQKRESMLARLDELMTISRNKFKNNVQHHLGVDLSVSQSEEGK